MLIGIGYSFNKRYEIKNKLGKGACGLVFRVYDETDKKEYKLDFVSYFLKNNFYILSYKKKQKKSFKNDG